MQVKQEKVIYAQNCKKWCGPMQNGPCEKVRNLSGGQEMAVMVV